MVKKNIFSTESDQPGQKLNILQFNVTYLVKNKIFLSLMWSKYTWSKIKYFLFIAIVLDKNEIFFS